MGRSDLSARNTAKYIWGYSGSYSDGAYPRHNHLVMFRSDGENFLMQQLSTSALVRSHNKLIKIPHDEIRGIRAEPAGPRGSSVYMSLACGDIIEFQVDGKPGHARNAFVRCLEAGQVVTAAS